MEALARSEASGSWEERPNMTNAAVYKELMHHAGDSEQLLEMWDW